MSEPLNPELNSTTLSSGPDVFAEALPQSRLEIELSETCNHAEVPRPRGMNINKQPPLKTLLTTETLTHPLYLFFFFKRKQSQAADS